MSDCPTCHQPKPEVELRSAEEFLGEVGPPEHYVFESEVKATKAYGRHLLEAAIEIVVDSVASSIAATKIRATMERVEVMHKHTWNPWTPPHDTSAGTGYRIRTCSTCSVKEKLPEDHFWPPSMCSDEG